MALPDTTSPAAEPAPASANPTPVAEPAPASANPAPAASDSATPPIEVQGYCVKCKAPRNMVQVQIVTTQNKRKAAKGKCPVCGTTMNKFLPK
jgi:hypothetical protein